LDNDNLAWFTTRQIENLLPDTDADLTHATILKCLPQTLERVHHLIDQVRMWTLGKFDHLHSSQYCIYLYLLANQIWLHSNEREVPTRLFLLNKAMNGIDLFYEIEMPPVFFIGHSVGIVLAKADYGNYLVLYQNSTVGKNHGIAPKIGEGVVMYPNSAIIGRSDAGANTVLSQGTGLVNCDSPGNCIVFQGADKQPVFRAQKDNQIAAAEYFRI